MAKRSTTYELQLKIGASTSASFHATIGEAKNTLTGLNKASNVILAGTTAALAAGGVAFTRWATEAEEAYKGFESEMATVKSISRATEKEYEMLKEAALAAGESTVYTAEQSASALEYMSLAGWDAQTSAKGLTPMLRIAAATGKDLAITSDLVTDSMSALAIGVDNMPAYLDKLIEANNDANTSAEQLMEALVKAGGSSRTLGVDLNDTITALEILANNGLKGEEAGTALNSVFVRLAGNTTAIKEMDQLGADIWDENGKFIGFKETLTEINRVLDGLTDEKRAKSLKNIAGIHYYSQLSYLLEAVENLDGAEVTAWESLETQIENSSGALDRMYSITTDTLEFAQIRLESASENMKIRLMDVFSNDAKEIVLWLADELPELTDSMVEFAETHQGEFAKAFEIAGESIEWVWDTGISAGKWVITNKSKVCGALIGIASGITAIKVASTGLTILQNLNKYQLIVTAALAAMSAIAGAVSEYAIAAKEAEEIAKQENLAEHFGQIALSMNEIDILSRQIVGDGNINRVATMLAAAADTASAFEDVEGIFGSIEKESWKINIGFNMNTDDYSDYGETIESYINTVENYAETKGYEVHIAATLLFGEGSQQDIDGSLFFSQIESQLEEYGSSLHDYLYNETNGALLDGIIDIDEDAIVQEYLSKINKITSAISEAEAAAKIDSLKLKYNGADLTPETMTQLQEDIGNYVQEVSEGAHEAYTSAMTEYHARLGLDDSYTQEDFERDSAEAWAAYYDLQTDAAMNGYNYMMDTLNAAYPELEEGLAQYQNDINEILSDYMDPERMDDIGWNNNANQTFQFMGWDVEYAIKSNLIDEDREVLQDYLDKMVPTVDAISQVVAAYENVGKDIPESLKEWQESYRLLSELVYEEDPMIALNNAIEGSDDFTAFLESLGYTIDETNLSLAEVVESTGTESATAAVDSVHEHTQGYIDDAFSSGFSVESRLDIALNPSYKRNLFEISNTKDYQSDTTKLYDLYDEKIYHNSAGGIYTRPIFTTFAEDGPESAIPLDGSERAKTLWLRTGQLLGMNTESRDEVLLTQMTNEEKSNQHIQIYFNPNVTITGNASKNEVYEGITLSMEELREMLKEITEENRRVAFG